LKTFAYELKSSLSLIINLSLQSGNVPEQWKLANVIPVHKANSKENVKNYRPISLLSVVSKVAERCIYNHIYPQVAGLINESQHGFTNGKSTTTQLLEFIDNIGRTLDCSGQTDIIYLDFSKAFDSVSHNLLIHKLKELGMSSRMLNWFNSYLRNRYQRVVVNGGTSKWLPVKSGVPQGSILGPLLFNIFISDMSYVPKHSNIVFYADDTKCFKRITNFNDCLALQSDLDLLCEWSVKWKLNFNALKCKLLSVTRNKNPVSFYYNMNGHILERVNNIKDLGVTVTDDLNWSTHIETILGKANKVSGLIKRTVGFNASCEAKKRLYMSMVRSNVEYCSQIWSGTSRSNVIKIERIQRSATRFILNYPNSDYKERLQTLNIMPLSYRREILDITFLYKCINGHFNVDISKFVSFSCNKNYQTRNTLDNLHLCTPHCNTESGKKLYYNRIVSIWNMLPYSIRNSTSVFNFKSSVNEHYNNLLNSRFLSDNVCTWTITCQCSTCRPY
jgi:hypothetical protein